METEHCLHTCLLPSSVPDNEGEEHGVADVSDGALLQHVPHLRDQGPGHNMSPVAEYSWRNLV